jgi:hypothetical protein
VFHVAFSRMGGWAWWRVSPKNLVPLAHLEHGGAFEDTLTVFGADVGKTVEVPLDELERYASQPFGVAIAPDKSRIYVTSGGSEMVTVIDVPRLLRFIHAHPAAGPFTQDLSASANYVVDAHCGGAESARADADAGWAQAVCGQPAGRYDQRDRYAHQSCGNDQAGRAEEVSALRHGEQTFYTARYSFQGQIGCANCHIDSTFDG